MIRVNVPSCRSLLLRHASGSDLWSDVTDEVSVDPVSNVIIYICYLEKLWNFGAFGAANDVNHVSHVPCPICFLMITAIPGLTWRKTGSVFWGVETPLS